MITIKELSANIDFPEDAYVTLLKAFLDETEGDLAAIKEAIPRKDEEKISERIHNIRGAALNLEFETISGLLGQLSTLNHAGKYDLMGEILDSLFFEVDILKRLV